MLARLPVEQKGGETRTEWTQFVFRRPRQWTRTSTATGMRLDGDTRSTGLDPDGRLADLVPPGFDQYAAVGTKEQQAPHGCFDVH